VAGAGAHLGEGRPPARDLWVVDLAWAVAVHGDDPAPCIAGALKTLLVLLARGAPWVAWPGQCRGVAAVDDDPQRPLGVGRGEKARHHAALGNAHNRGLLRADRVEHRADVVHALLERRQRVDAVGHA